MKRSNLFSNLAVILILGFWAYGFFQIPTFDLDESLYRRVAEEMKWNRDYWHAVWDGRPLHHKPPFFYWLMVIFSRLFDGAESGVSILAARFPNFLAVIGIVFSLSRVSNFRSSLLTWGTMLFPLATATAVLFDPIQTLLLMPSILIPHRAFSEGRWIRRKEYFWMALSLAGATLFKGLNGLIIPSVAIALHSLIFNWKNIIPAGLRYMGFTFLPAAALSALGFWWLDQKIGRAFTEEFFLVHHFGRGSQAMESHGGPWYYHLVTTLLGGGLLLPLLMHHWLRVRPDYRRWGYPLTFAAGTILFFSFSATKLPHYTWPIWPALALSCLAIGNQSSSRQESRFSETWKLLLIPHFVFGLAIFWLVLHPELLPQTEFEDWEVLFLSAGATFCVVVPFVFRKFLKTPAIISFFNVLITGLITVSAISVAERQLVTPFDEIALELKKHNAQPTDCIRYNGPMSASLSLSLVRTLGHSFTHNRCEPALAKFVISSKAREKGCPENKMSVLHEGKTLILCGHL